MAYAHARWHLRRLTLPDAVAALRAPSSRSVELENPAADARRLGRAVARTLSVLPTDSRCLVRSLVLTRLLERRGISSTLVIAVRPGDRLAAHAWIERDREPLLPPGTAGFERLLEL